MTTLSPIRNIDSVAAATGRTPTGMPPIADVTGHLPLATRGPSLSLHLRQRITRDFQARWLDEWGGKPLTQGLVPGPQAVRLDAPRLITALPSSVEREVLFKDPRAEHPAEWGRQNAAVMVREADHGGRETFA